MAGKKIEDLSEIGALVNKSVYGVLSMSDGGSPYAVPLNIIWDDGYFYLHSGLKGRKMEILAKNPKVSLTFVPEASFVVRHERSACGASMDFTSICVSGTAEVLGEGSSLDQRRDWLMKIVRHYGLEKLPIDEPVLAKTGVVRVRPDFITAMRKPG